MYQGSTATCIHLTKNLSSPLVGKVILFNQACSFGRDAHGLVREEGDTHLASQISQINPSYQWGDRCYSQIPLTYNFRLILTETLSVSPARGIPSPGTKPIDLHEVTGRTHSPNGPPYLFLLLVFQTFVIYLTKNCSL